MKTKIKIAVLGGTGKAGQYLVQELLNQHFPFKLLLRQPENFKIQSPLIELVKGDARDYSAIRELLAGCDAVISTLGQPKGEASIFSEATKHVIRAMQEYNIHHYIVTTGLNVDTPLDAKGPQTKFSTDWMKTNYPLTTLDKQLEYSILVESTINWTLVRLPWIEQTSERGEVRVSLEDCPGDKISATSLADFLIKQLQDNQYARQAPFIANA